MWLVAGHGEPRPRRILAAVHASPEDPTEQRLNRAILDMAATLGDLMRADLTIVQAWSVWGENLLKSRLSPDEFSKLLEEARKQAAQELRALTDALGDRLSEAGTELIKGEPEEVIPHFVEAQGIDVVVMGTVARTGIAGLLIGNTAERVLQRVLCSVVALKPPGFESPVMKDWARA